MIPIEFFAIWFVVGIVIFMMMVTALPNLFREHSNYGITTPEFYTTLFVAGVITFFCLVPLFSALFLSKTISEKQEIIEVKYDERENSYLMWLPKDDEHGYDLVSFEETFGKTYTDKTIVTRVTKQQAAWFFENGSITELKLKKEENE